MTNFEAIEMMKAGKKVRHRYFDRDEWMTIENGIYVFEDRVKCPPYVFWHDRSGVEWLTDWEEWTPPPSAQA